MIVITKFSNCDNNVSLWHDKKKTHKSYENWSIRQMHCHVSAHHVAPVLKFRLYTSRIALFIANFSICANRWATLRHRVWRKKTVSHFFLREKWDASHFFCVSVTRRFLSQESQIVVMRLSHDNETSHAENPTCLSCIWHEYFSVMKSYDITLTHTCLTIKC